MPNIRRIRVTLDIAGPFETGGVGVPGADVARLEGFELLSGAEFVCLEGEVS